MKHAVGIDLGTTHSAVATAPDEGAPAVLEVPQLTSPGVVERLPLLPSFLYLSGAAEFPPGSLALPWGEAVQVAGAMARSHGAMVPGRLVSSAKSWLSHPTVDPRGAGLPPQAPSDVVKVSAVAASARYVAHLAAAWELAHEGQRLADQDVVLTVPASFDVGARALTTEAAAEAGLSQVTLLEEPQAAMYAWLEALGDGWRKQLKVGDVVLVVDVGGGTSDFSLIGVSEEGGALRLDRLAVGDHILLGGDNMDLALAYAVKEQIPRALDAVQMAGLVAAARSGKEALFSGGAKDTARLSVASRGRSLVGGTVSADLSRALLEQVVVDGFFPEVRVDEVPVSAARSGLVQVGLPYARDPAVTRHLASFLSRQAGALRLGTGFVQPTALLLNGGVFKARPIRDRLVAQVNGWLGEAGAAPVRVLEGADLDLAVAKGAAAYARVKASGTGVRIRGGTGQAYYVGVESSMPAVPGRPPPVNAVCLAPLGMEEGSSAVLPLQEFGVVVGQPTRFRFFASSTRREDRPGAVVEEVDELTELPAIETTLEGTSGAVVPVRLEAAVTELGALELRCAEQGGPGRWKLELNVRAEPADLSRLQEVPGRGG